MTTTVLHICVEENLEKQASETLASLGLSLSEAIPLILEQIIINKTLPFIKHNPNDETIAALEACRRGDTVGFNSIEALMDELNADD